MDALSIVVVVTIPGGIGPLYVLKFGEYKPELLVWVPVLPPLCMNTFSGTGSDASVKRYLLFLPMLLKAAGSMFRLFFVQKPA